MGSCHKYYLLCISKIRKPTPRQAWWYTPLTPALRGKNQADLCEFRTSPGFKASSRQAKATQCPKGARGTVLWNFKKLQDWTKQTEKCLKIHLRIRHVSLRGTETFPCGLVWAPLPGLPHTDFAGLNSHILSLLFKAWLSLNGIKESITCLIVLPPEC